MICEDNLGVDQFRFLARDGLAGGDVGGVGLPSPGHPDVQRAAVQGAGDEQVGGAGGPALGDVGVARVAQLAVAGQVPLGYQERVGPAAFDLAAHPYLAMDQVLDAEHVTVGQRLPCGVDRLGVFPGPHEVTDARPVAAGELEPRLLNASCTDELVLDAPCKIGGFGVGAAQQDGVLSGEEVSQEPRRGFVVHGLAVPGTDPAVRVVGGQDALVAAAELERGGRFPRAGEPAYLGQFGGAELGGEPAEPVSGLHGPELGRVTDAQDPGRARCLLDQRKIGGPDLPGLVDDKLVGRAGLDGMPEPVRVAALAQELGDVVGLGQALGRHDPGGVLAEGQADQPAAGEGVPYLGGRGDGPGLTCPGGGRSAVPWPGPR
jgi:hypothetical protein